MSNKQLETSRRRNTSKAAQRMCSGLHLFGRGSEMARQEVSWADVTMAML